MKRICTLAIGMLLMTAVAWAAENTLNYQILPNMILDAHVIDGGDEYAVVIELKSPYRDELYQLTNSNMGNRLIIEVSGKIFTSAIIKTAIPSGLIQGHKCKSKSEAERYIKHELKIE